MKYNNSLNYANVVLLKAKIKQKGYSVYSISQALDLPYTTFLEKTKGIGHFSIVEITKLYIFLKLSPEECYEIFFKPYETIFLCIYHKICPAE